MRQIDIIDDYTAKRRGGELYQTFYIDTAADFPYYRPAYLIVAENDKQAAASGKNQYFLDHMSQIRREKWNERRRQIKVIAKLANEQKDKEIEGYVTKFNEAKNIPSRTAAEVAHRIAEEKIHKLILDY